MQMCQWYNEPKNRSNKKEKWALEGHRSCCASMSNEQLNVMASSGVREAIKEKERRAKKNSK